MQSIIATAGARAPGLRDERRMARHISHCQPCRRYAVLAGVDVTVRTRRPAVAKIAAFLPMPEFLRRRWSIGQPESTLSVHAANPQLTQWTANVAQSFDPSVAGWGKAVATAATVAIAGIGAGAATHTPSPLDGGPVSPGAIVKRLGGGERGAMPAQLRTPASTRSGSGSAGVPSASAVPLIGASRSGAPVVPIGATAHGITGPGAAGRPTAPAGGGQTSAPVKEQSSSTASPSAPAAADAPSTPGRTDGQNSAPPSTGITSTPSSGSSGSTAAQSEPSSQSLLPNLSGATDRRPGSVTTGLPSTGSSGGTSTAPEMQGSVAPGLKLTPPPEPSADDRDVAGSSTTPAPSPPPGE